MGFYTNKNVLVTGGTGLIGQQLVELLINNGAEVRIASLDNLSLANPKAEFRQTNLMNLDNCINVCKNINYVFHLAGIKGSPKMSSEKPASFFVPIILFNTNMLEAARQCDVERYLYTSSIGVYAPAEIFHEDDVWKTFPSQNDRFPGWAKRMGELQVEAYRIEYGWDKISIVRPANIYGPYDKFDLERSHVFGATITKVLTAKDNKINVWGTGEEERDLLFVSDLVDFIELAIYKQQSKFEIYNVSTGSSISVNGLVEKIMEHSGKKLRIEHDMSKPTIPTKLSLDSTKAKKDFGWNHKLSLDNGIDKTIRWYKENILYK